MHEAVSEGLNAVHKRRDHDGGDTAELPCAERRDRSGGLCEWGRNGGKDINSKSGRKPDAGQGAKCDLTERKRR